MHSVVPFSKFHCISGGEF